MMIQTRRSFLNSILGWLLAWRWGLAWPGAPGRNAVAGDKLSQAISRETGGRQPADSGKISLDAPDTAENGAIVPVTVESELPGVDAIWIFVEKNPSPLAARFDFDHTLDPFVSLRIKMNESCDVIAMVKSGDGYFSTRKKVRVVLGGCG